MRKRKKPYLLMTVLIIALGIVATLNFPRDANAHAGHNHSQEPAAQGEAREAPTREELAANASKSAAPLTALEEREVKPSTPTLVVPKQEVHRPVPNDSTIAGQWYSDEAVKDLSGGNN
jgi:hypothetical protein